jgi:hypothetical protein
MMTSAWMVAAAVGAMFGLHMRTVSQERCGGHEVWFWVSTKLAGILLCSSAFYKNVVITGVIEL